ncbi:MAG: DMT family transporter [Rhizobacter sp.]
MKDKKSGLTIKAIAYWVFGAYLVTGMQAAAKLAAHYGLSIRESMSARYVGGLLLALAIMWVVRRSLRSVRSANWRLQTQRSVAVAVITFGVFTSAKLIGLGLSTAFGYSWPAFSQVVGWQRWLGFNEKPDFRSALSVLLTFIGVGMLARARLHPAASSSDFTVMVIGTGAVLLASVCSGYQANIAPKIKAVDQDPFTGLVWLMFIGALVMMVWSAGSWALPGSSTTLPVISITSVIVALAIPVCGTMGQFFYIQAQVEAPTRLLTPLTSIFQLPFALAMGHFAFGEAWPSFEEGLWMAVIIGGSLLNYLPMPNPGPSAKPQGSP